MQSDDRVCASSSDLPVICRNNAARRANLSVLQQAQTLFINIYSNSDFCESSATPYPRCQICIFNISRQLQVTLTRAPLLLALWLTAPSSPISALGIDFLSPSTLPAQRAEGREHERSLVMPKRLGNPNLTWKTHKPSLESDLKSQIQIPPFDFFLSKRSELELAAALCRLLGRAVDLCGAEGSINRCYVAHCAVFVTAEITRLTVPEAPVGSHWSPTETVCVRFSLHKSRQFSN